MCEQEKYILERLKEKFPKHSDWEDPEKERFHIKRWSGMTTDWMDWVLDDVGSVCPYCLYPPIGPCDCEWHG